MLTIDTVHEFMIDRGIISEASFMNGDYEATSANRRNCNIQITTRREGSYLVKQPFDQTSESAGTLEREIRFYQYLAADPARLPGITAVARLTDAERRMLVLDFLTPAQQLWKYYRARGADDLPFATIRAIGRLLARLHRSVPVAPGDGGTPGFLPRDLPFGLTINKPRPGVMGHIAAGGMDYLRDLQSSAEVMRAWEDAVAAWRVDAVIHGDVKLDNFLVMTPGDDPADGHADIRIVDWELVQHGDSAWDIAGVLQDFLFWWTISLPDGLPARDMVRQAPFSIHKLKPGIRCFWQAYCEARPVDAGDQRDLMAKSVGFAGIRTLQTAYEIAAKFDGLPPIAEVLTGIGQSILKSPGAAQRDLFGLDGQAQPKGAVDVS